MLSAPVLYLLKAHAVLLLFAAGYFGLLHRLTFFGLNRAYLAFALLFAAAYPWLPVPALWPAAAPAPAVAWVLAELPAGAPAAALPAPGPDWPAWLLAAYGAGVALLLGRLLVQLVSLARLHRAARPAGGPSGGRYRQLAGGGGPFSFGRTVYLDPAQHPAPAELAAVLAHEHAHVRQAHTLDVVLAHVATALFWPNPVAWLLRRALLDNLEYLADAATLRTGLDRRAYQYSLLRLGPAAGSPALVSPFSFSTLKNRIRMMNQPLSTRLQLLRYALAGPLVVAAALAYSAAHAQAAPEPAAAAGELFAVAKLDETQPAPADLATVAKEPRASITATKTKLPMAVTLKKVRPAILNRLGNSSQAEATPARDGGPNASPDAALQARPTAAKQPVYYVDGKLVGSALGTDVEPASIARIDVLKGKQARELLGDAPSADGVIIVTTKAKMDLPEVVEFNEKVRRLEPLTGLIADRASSSPTQTTAPPVGREVVMGYVAAPALAYITKNYPDCRLGGQVIETTNPQTGQLNYWVQIVRGRRPMYVAFDKQGQFVSK